MRKLFVTTLIALFIAVVAVILFLPNIIGFAGVWWLQQKGYRDIEFNALNVEWEGRLFVESVKVVSDNFELKTNEFEIQFDFERRRMVVDISKLQMQTFSAESNSFEESNLFKLSVSSFRKFTQSLPA